MPAFLQSDDDDGEVAGDGLLSGVNANRRRRQYDEVPDMDDVEGEEEVGSQTDKSQHDRVKVLIVYRRCRLSTLVISRRRVSPSGSLSTWSVVRSKNISRVSS